MAREKPIILDDDDPPPRRSREPKEASRSGFEMGLASVLLGATLLIVGAKAHEYVIFLTASRAMNHDSTIYSFLSYLGVFTFIGAELICIVGVMMGMRGMARARAEGGSIALPVAGFLLSLFAVFIWIFAAIVLMTRSA